MRKIIFVLSVFFAVSMFAGLGSVHADWASRFVVNDGKSYTVSNITVDNAQIGAKLGKVTSYSDKEGTYSGNFSNYYAKGTEYYTIKDLAHNEAIAIKVSDDSFIMATYSGEYEGSNFSLNKVLTYVGVVFLLIIVIVLVRNNWKRTR